MKTILLVDKDERFLEVGELMVSSLGYRVVISADGADAVIKAATERPDLILMEIDLPVMSGLKAVATMREQSTTRAIPVVAMTASTFLRYEDKLRDFGFDGYLAKPFTRKQLQQTIEAVSTPRQGTDR